MVSDSEIRKMIEAWFPNASGEDVTTLAELFVMAAIAIDEEPSEPS